MNSTHTREWSAGQGISGSAGKNVLQADEAAFRGVEALTIGYAGLRMAASDADGLVEICQLGTHRCVAMSVAADAQRLVRQWGHCWRLLDNLRDPEECSAWLLLFAS